MPVLFHFKPGGKVEITPTGYAGGQCRRVTALLTKGMGDTESDVPTAEALEPEHVPVSQPQEQQLGQ